MDGIAEGYFSISYNMDPGDGRYVTLSSMGYRIVNNMATFPARSIFFLLLNGLKKTVWRKRSDLSNQSNQKNTHRLDQSILFKRLQNQFDLFDQGNQ